MKTFVLAGAPAVAMASALLGLNLGGDDGLGLDLGLGVDVKLPLGIELQIGDDNKPTQPPPADCTNVWHPPHHDTDMDGCDNHGDGDWHWVHPCEHCQTEKPHSWTTSTVKETTTHTVIDCEPTVTDCPGHQTKTITVPATTTICPVEVTKTGEVSVPVVTAHPTVHPTITDVPVETISCPPIDTEMPPQTMITKVQPTQSQEMPPVNTVPGDNMPGDNVPGDNVPGDNMPGDNVPGDNVPGDNGNGCPGGVCPPADTGAEMPPFPTGEEMPVPTGGNMTGPMVGAGSKLQGAGMAIVAGLFAALI